MAGMGGFRRSEGIAAAYDDAAVHEAKNGHHRPVTDFGGMTASQLNAVIQSRLLVHGNSAELNYQYWPAAQGMLAVPLQRRCVTDD
jgi:hypothetical protein